MLISCGYGHMAEGDINISIGVEGDKDRARLLRAKVVKIADQFLVDFVCSKGGSVTGEVGVGV